MHAGGQPLPHLLAPRRPGVLRAASRASSANSVSPQSRRAKPEQGEVRRQQPAVGQVVHRRQQLLAGQVAGDAEDHQGAGLGDPGQPPVPRIAQRVGDHDQSSRSAGLRCAGRSRWWAAGQARAARSWPMPAARSVRWRCRRGRLRSASALRSPAAWAACRLPNVYGLVGHREVLGDRPGDLQEGTRLRTALVVLAGGVQEARSPAEGHGVRGPARPARSAGRRRSASASRSR